MRNQNNKKIEGNNCTRLLIFDKINFYLPKMTSVVYCRTFLHFMSSLFNNLNLIIIRNEGKTYPLFFPCDFLHEHNLEVLQLKH